MTGSVPPVAVAGQARIWRRPGEPGAGWVSLTPGGSAWSREPAPGGHIDGRHRTAYRLHAPAVLGHLDGQFLDDVVHGDGELPARRAGAPGHGQHAAALAG